jgi:AAHS family 4-hydroxybenzoate transporter-like MFS transporter
VPAAKVIDVQEFINAHKFSGVQVTLLVLCFLIVGIDGFDTASIGFIAPAIRSDWGLTPAQLAPLFGSGLFGLMIGAFAIGPFADRYGRKAVLIFAVVFFGAASLASAYSPNLAVLILLRFLTGLGLGGAMPNAITLTSEYCQEGRRSFLVTLMFCGFTIGSALGGIVASQIVAGYGWHSVLIVGGVLPLMLAPVLWWALPESVRFLVMRGCDTQRIVTVLHRIAPDADLGNMTFTGARKPHGSPVRQVFDNDLRRGTLLLWLAFFMSLLVVYLLSSWLPTLINSSGMSLRTASLITAMFQVGGTVGAVTIGRLMDKINPHHVLGIAYASAAIFIFLIGHASDMPWLLVLAVFGAGFFVSGSQVGANALAAAYYPTASRATGVSWANGVGRIGSVLGSMLGGFILSLDWGLPTVFGIVAVPTVIAGLAIFVMGLVCSRLSQLPAADLTAAQLGVR